jgi:hypothetical protein
MNTALSTFLKVGVTVVVIVALLFSVGYGMIETETEYYKDNKISNTNFNLDTSGSSTR